MTEPTDVGPDRDLGRRLRSLPVPDHGDEFFDRLRGRLAAESAFTGAPSYRGRSARVIELSAARPQPVRRPPSRARRLVTLATAPAAAVACFALVVGGAVVVHRPGDRGTPRPIESGTRWSADNRTVDRPDRADRLTAAAPYESTERGLAIAFTTRASSRAGLVQSSYQATVTPSGDYRLLRTAPRLEAAYSAEHRTRRLARAAGAGTAPVVEQQDLPLGPPDGPALSTPDRQLSRDLAAAVRAIAVEQPGRVSRGELMGRPVVTLDEPLEPGAGFTEGSQTVDRVRIVVDEQTGLPLEVRLTSAGALFREITVQSIDETPVAPASLTPTAPDEVRPPATSLGHRPVPIDDVQSVTGRAPAVPRWAPDGFQLTGVTVAGSLPTTGSNPASRDVVTLAYRRGYDTFTVTTRLTAPATGPAGDGWRNPLVDGTYLPDRTDPTPLVGGLLDGRTAHVGIYPLVWPHLWVEAEDLVVTVAGDLTRGELVRVAESLTPHTTR
ncbi:MAG TPA: hypothetical protein VEZ46_14990 [Mycobacteriales bacterium]|nr:hypothetical protein [Mycobacteriales bacterium]